MNETEFLALLSPAGQDALYAAMGLQPREKDFLRLYQTLAKRYPRKLARAALETAILRGQAQSKFPQAQKMYFTREPLEQASVYEVAAHRAKRYRGCELIADLGCSIGGDTIALAEVAPAVGLDRDPLRLLMARENLRGLGLQADFIQTDLTVSLPLRRNPHTGLFFDPARRKNGRRIKSVQRYIPPLGAIIDWRSRFPAIGVKISPGVNLHELSAYDAEVEFVSLHGELKEAILWFGPLKDGQRRATVLPGRHTLADDLSPLPSARHLPPTLSQPQRFFYEPDPAVIRSGMVRTLMAHLGAAQIDEEIAYLTADEQVETPFARVWEVEDWFPFQLKRLRAYLRERKVGQVTVKKRGSPIVPEDLIRNLRLDKENPEKRVVFLTQMRSNPIVVVCF